MFSTSTTTSDPVGTAFMKASILLFPSCESMLKRSDAAMAWETGEKVTTLKPWLNQLSP